MSAWLHRKSRTANDGLFAVKKQRLLKLPTPENLIPAHLRAYRRERFFGGRSREVWCFRRRASDFQAR
jgi:hypothetical protein